MNPVQLKKNGHKKILRISAFLILSMLIHCTIFITISIFWNKNQNLEKKRSSEPTIVKVLLNYKSTVNKNDIAKEEKKEVKNKIKSFNKTKNIQKTLALKSINEVTIPLNEKEILKINSETKSNEVATPKPFNSNLQQKEIVTLINPFGFLKLPKSLLGQNLFPKKYTAHFKVNEKNGKIIEFHFQGLITVQEQMLYIDTTIQKAFENQIKNIPKELLLNWLESLQGIYEITPSSTSPKPSTDSLSIVLEFQEPN